MPNAILIAEHLSKLFVSPSGPLTVLEDINFKIQRGETVAVVGTSGSGKSTLLALLAGLEIPSRGRCILDGQDLSQLDEDARARVRRERVGFVFQQFHLLPAFSALENVMLPLELTGAPDARARALMILETVGLGDRWHHYPRQLSGGEQQRVALARAYCTAPALLMADEPTGNLDASTARQITDLLFDLNARLATTLVLITHDERLAARCARTLRLAAGRLIDA
ncbi:MAG: ATP-binding cassette domain-containing protein [Gammaproteobacteria bacterium]|nr:ATP-binding cassette domain-containing protein [Gammaproteobacteria bacterium]